MQKDKTMSTKEFLLIFTYILPVLIALDKDELKTALFLFVLLMAPILFKIHTSSFEFIALTHLICWIASFIFLKSIGLFRK